MKYTNEQMRIYMNAYRAKRRSAAIAQLGGMCCKCESTESLQFDHVDPSSKKSIIANMFALNNNRLQEELSKCQLLCQPCHTQKTAVDLGYKLRKGNHGTLGSYRYCRPSCDACRKAASEAMQKYRQTHERKKYNKRSIPG